MERLDHRSNLLDQAKQISYPKDSCSDNTLRKVMPIYYRSMRVTAHTTHVGRAPTPII